MTTALTILALLLAGSLAAQTNAPVFEASVKAELTITNTWIVVGIEPMEPTGMVKKVKEEMVQVEIIAFRPPDERGKVRHYATNSYRFEPRVIREKEMILYRDRLVDVTPK